MTLDLPEGSAPLGLAIDVNGDMWTGLYQGSAVIKIDPKAKAIVQTIALPTPLIAAPAFGGPELDVLYVATSNLPIDYYSGVVSPPLRKPPAGNLFMIRGLSAKGAPSYRLTLPKCV